MLRKGLDVRSGMTATGISWGQLWNVHSRRTSTQVQWRWGIFLFLVLFVPHGVSDGTSEQGRAHRHILPTGGMTCADMHIDIEEVDVREYPF